MANFITADEYIQIASEGVRPRYQVLTPALHISKGNSKMGKVFNLSKLAGNGIQLDGNGTPITNVLGSCNMNCKGCYDCASQSLCRENVIRAWAENTLLARNPEALEDALSYWFEKHVNRRANGEPPAPFRIHQSGELESVEELRVWAHIASKYETYGYTFYTYTKRFDIVEEFTRENGGFSPFNLNINLSECEGVEAPEYLKARYNVFVWDTGQASELPHCPAVLKPVDGRKKGARNKGVTCAQCGRCFDVTSRCTAVYNH